MSYSTGTVPSCGYCGKPIIGAGVWIFGVAYHLECTCGLSAEFAKESERIADLQRQLAEAKADNKEMLSVMMAAAVEIKEHWDAHCDAEGYGPANLLRRLETGVTGGGYGYTAETVVDMQAEIEAMRPMVEACMRRYERHYAGDECPCQCPTCQWYRDYLDRKQP